MSQTETNGPQGGTFLTFTAAQKDNMKSEVKDFIELPEARKIEITRQGTGYKVVFIAVNDLPPPAGPDA